MSHRSYTLLALAFGAALAAAGCSKQAPDDGAEEVIGEAAADPAPGAARAQPGADETAAEDSTVYGEGVHQSEAVPITQILADPEAYAGKTVRVEGTVTDVCPKRGCWFDMAGEEPGQKLRFKVQDGVMVFPMGAKGKHAVAEGVVALQPLSLEQTRQYLEYQAREYGSDVDPASVTEPMTIVRIDGTGALIRD